MKLRTLIFNIGLLMLISTLASCRNSVEIHENYCFMDFELNENELPSEGNQLLFFTAHSAQGSKGSGSINIARIKATLIKNDFDIYSLYVDDRDSCGSFSKKIVHRALLNKMGYNSLPLYVYVKEGRIRYIHGKEFQVSDLDLALKD